MTEEEIEEQAEKYYQKPVLQTVRQAFKDGAEWGMETICKKILEEVENKYKVFGIAYDWGFVKIRLEEIIKELGVDL